MSLCANVESRPQDPKKAWLCKCGKRNPAGFSLCAARDCHTLFCLECGLTGHERRHCKQLAAGAGEAAEMAQDFRYKTSLCRHFMAHGRCGYGARCHFAHGEDDLRSGAFEKEARRASQSGPRSPSSSASETSPFLQPSLEAPPLWTEPPADTLESFPALTCPAAATGSSSGRHSPDSLAAVASAPPDSLAAMAAAAQELDQYMSEGRKQFLSPSEQFLSPSEPENRPPDEQLGCSIKAQTSSAKRSLFSSFDPKFMAQEDGEPRRIAPIARPVPSAKPREQPPAVWEASPATVERPARTRTLPQKVECIRDTMDLPKGGLIDILKEANSQLGVEPSGGLIQQADALLAMLF